MTGLLPALSARRADGAPRETYHVETWGCQMNVLDGERMGGQLEALGLSRAADGAGESAAKVVILNTCAVREKAQDKVFSALGVLARRKQDDPELVVGVTGCVAQVSGPEILERAPWIDFVAGTGQVEKIGDLVAAARAERRRAMVLELPEEDPVYQFRQISRGSRFQAYVTVIEGCEQYCTFCIVPFTRGRERSRAAAEIVEEVRHLADQGFSEVTLLGQTVNAYREPSEGFGLGELLRRVGVVDGIRRLRFITSHPRFVGDDLLAAMAEVPTLAPYLHLPAQSGSDRVLSRMKRRYTSAEYRATAQRIRQRVPNIALSSDFIVGFPGETDGDFEETLALVRDLRFASLFGFRYSPRPGTASARWGSEIEVAAETSARRLQALLDLQGVIQREENGRLVGREFEILVEGRNRHGQTTGRTPCNRIVHLEPGPRADSLTPGSYVHARITRGLPNSLAGSLAA